MYGSETGGNPENENAGKMRFLRKIEDKSRIGRVRNEKRRQQLRTEPTQDKITEGQLSSSIL